VNAGSDGAVVSEISWAPSVRTLSTVSTPSATGLSVIGGRLYFAADDGVHGTELWSSDGTPEATQMVEDLSPGYIPGILSYRGTALNGERS
jgi:ELWxxDGT repeat protein